MTALFHTPPQDLPAPTQFAVSADALARWLENLPKANLGQSTRSLYQALTELNRVKMPPAQRHALLEGMRPAVQRAAQSLARHYLNQPVVLQEQQQKVVELTHALSEQLATGYILVATHTAEEDRRSGFAQPEQAIATAVHRALMEYSQMLLRDCQLYRSPPPGCWRTLHQLANLARAEGVLQQAVVDDGRESTLEAAYLRALLLGGAKTYQLRQDDLAKLFAHLLEWAPHVDFCPPEQALLVFNPASDDGPMYREFAPIGPGWLGLQTETLTHELMRRREAAEANPAEPDLSADLLGHLLHSWSTASKRAFLRIEINEHVDLALGLTATHHFISGETEFSLLLNSTPPSTLALADDNLFLRSGGQVGARASKDVWDSPYTANAQTQVSIENIDFHIREHSAKESEKKREKFRFHTVGRVNISPGGLCVKWPPDNSSQVRTGEIIGIRENNHKNWSVGVIRWLRILESGPQLGIELLSPTAAPYGARVVTKTGPQGDYLRVLVLPEIRQTGQPTTLITPRLPFRAGQKVTLLHRDKETRIQLVRRVASTAAFSQFEFRRLSGVNTGAESGPAVLPKDTGFDSLWDRL